MAKLISIRYQRVKPKLRNRKVGMLTQHNLAQKERGKDLTTQGSGRRPTGEPREGAKMEKQTTMTGDKMTL